MPSRIVGTCVNEGLQPLSRSIRNLRAIDLLNRIDRPRIKNQFAITPTAKTPQSKLPFRRIRDNIILAVPLEYLWRDVDKRLIGFRVPKLKHIGKPSTTVFRQKRPRCIRVEGNRRDGLKAIEVVRRTEGSTLSQVCRLNDVSFRARIEILVTLQPGEQATGNHRH
jgi:hypothetical protein